MQEFVWVWLQDPISMPFATQPRHLFAQDHTERGYVQEGSLNHWDSLYLLTWRSLALWASLPSRRLQQVSWPVWKEQESDRLT